VGPSGRIQEDGIFIIWDDSYMLVIAPEDPPVGQDVEVVDWYWWSCVGLG